MVVDVILFRGILFADIETCEGRSSVPGLLRFSNGIETNPGPSVHEVVNAAETVYADFSQGRLDIFEQNAGKQCVAICP